MGRTRAPDVTYSTSILTNKAVFPDDLFVKDFSILEDIDEKRILLKKVSKYLEDIGEVVENTAKETPFTKNTVTTEPPVVPTDGFVDLHANEAAPSAPLYSTTQTDPTVNRPKRYTYR